MNVSELKRVASQIRRDIIRMIHGCQSGHPGGSLGAADLVTALYFDQMQIEPTKFCMDGKGEDMFFLSNLNLGDNNDLNFLYKKYFQYVIHLY